MILEGRLTNIRCAIRRRLSFLNKPFYKHFGKRALVYKPFLLSGSKNIEIGDYSFISYGARIEANKIEGKVPSLKIGKGCSIEQRLHLVCTESITIGDNCMISSNCMINDAIHSLDDINIPYNKQKIISKPITIGNNVFIGVGSFIMAGTKLGNNVIVGANSVVKGEFEDNVMVVGAPARIVKRYNKEKKRWEHV